MNPEVTLCPPRCTGPGLLPCVSLSRLVEELSVGLLHHKVILLPFLLNKYLHEIPFGHANLLSLLKLSPADF